MTQKESEKNIHAVFITDEFFYFPHFPHFPYSPHSQNRVIFSSQNKHPTAGHSELRIPNSELTLIYLAQLLKYLFQSLRNLTDA